MRLTNIIVISGAFVTSLAIAAATVAVTLGHLDSAAFASILGAALGFGAGAGVHAVGVANGNGQARPPVQGPPGG